VKNPVDYHNKEIDLAGVLCSYNLQQAVTCIELKKRNSKHDNYDSHIFNLLESKDSGLSELGILWLQIPEV